MKARLGSFCLALVVGLVMSGCGSNSSSVTIGLSPTSATVLLGTSFQFTATPIGSTNAVQWSVDGVPNGNATVGTISSTGLYTAPVTRPARMSPEVSLSASRVSETVSTATRTATRARLSSIFPPGANRGAFIEGSVSGCRALSP